MCAPWLCTKFVTYWTTCIQLISDHFLRIRSVPLAVVSSQVFKVCKVQKRKIVRSVYFDRHSTQINVSTRSQYVYDQTTIFLSNKITKPFLTQKKTSNMGVGVMDWGRRLTDDRADGAKPGGGWWGCGEGCKADCVTPMAEANERRWGRVQRDWDEHLSRLVSTEREIACESYLLLRESHSAAIFVILRSCCCCCCCCCSWCGLHGGLVEKARTLMSCTCQTTDLPTEGQGER